MEGGVVVTCSVVGLLGILSASAGFAAEATRIKVNKDTIYVCVYIYIYIHTHYTHIYTHQVAEIF